MLCAFVLTNKTYQPCIACAYRFDPLGGGRGQCITKDGGRFLEAILKNPYNILKCSNDCCLEESPPKFAADGIPYRQFVTDAQLDLMQPLLDLIDGVCLHRHFVD